MEKLLLVFMSFVVIFGAAEMVLGVTAFFAFVQTGHEPTWLVYAMLTALGLQVLSFIAAMTTMLMIGTRG